MVGTTVYAFLMDLYCLRFPDSIAMTAFLGSVRGLCRAGVVSKCTRYLY